jgi:hypothetical protein
MANALTNFELIDLIKDFKLDNHFGGVYSKDQLPELIKDKFYIVNLQGGGTHWRRRWNILDSVPL